MAGEQKQEMKLMSGGAVVALLLAILGLGVGAYRLVYGLGAVTNLSDQYPWGLWISFDVMAGVALAAGGFTTTFAAYVLGWKKYKAVVRPAVLTAFLGYTLVGVGLFFDVGKPWQLWHPIINWNPQSMLFEVAWCVMLYLTVLFLEFSPNLFEGMGSPGLAKFMRNPVVLFPLVIAGIILSFGHQNSLGGLFLLSSAKLSHLWWSPLMNYWFYLSAVAAGLAMVSFETIVSHRSFKMEQPLPMLDGLARGTAVALAVYLGARGADLAVRGNLGLIFSEGKAGPLFLIEVVGLVALAVFLYRWAVVALPIMTHEEVH